MKKSDNIHGSAHKGIWRCDGGKDFGWLSDGWSTPLAFFAFSRKLLAISDHRWPVVSMTFDFYCQRSPTRMVAAGTIMYFLHYFSRFFPFQTRHKWSGESPFVNIAIHCYVVRGLRSDFAGCPFLGGQLPVDNVVSICLQPCGIAAVIRLLRFSLYRNFFFLVIFTFYEVNDDWWSDARMFDELDQNYPFKSRSELDARAARASAWTFSERGIHVREKQSNS